MTQVEECHPPAPKPAVPRPKAEAKSEAAVGIMSEALLMDKLKSHTDKVAVAAKECQLSDLSSPCLNLREADSNTWIGSGREVDRIPEREAMGEK